MDSTYEQLLDRAFAQLPDLAAEKSDFKIPEVDSIIQGSKTIVRNFSQALKTVKRAEKHFYKYLTKETATAAAIEDGKLNMTGKFYPDQLNKLFTNYLNEYVLCHECKKPDTEIVERSGIKLLKCKACGALSPLKKI